MFLLFSFLCVQWIQKTVEIDGVNFECRLSDKPFKDEKAFKEENYFIIGNGKQTAIVEQNIEKESITIRDSISVDNIKYVIYKVDDFAFSNNNFRKIVFNFSSTYYYDNTLIIGTHTFENSYRLEEVDLSLTSSNEIPDFCFFNCTSLTAVLPCRKMTSFGAYSFAYSGIPSIKIGAKIQKIGKFIFKGSNLVKADLETSIFKYLPGSLFEECQKLEYVVLPNMLITLPKRCFYSSSVRTIKIPQSLKSLSEYSFFNCTNIQKIFLDQTSVTSIPKHCFENTPKLTEIYLSDINTIDENAFTNSGLTQFKIPRSITSLQNSFMSSSENLVEVDFSNTTIKALPHYAFYKCSKLSKIILPSTLEKIESYALSMTNLIDFSIGNTHILDEGAFADCVNLKSIDLTSLKASFLPTKIFYNCHSLATLKWPNTKIFIDSYAFYNCTSLSRIAFENISEIVGLKDSAFSSCVNLEYVNLSKATFKEYSRNLFSNTGKLTIDWPSKETCPGFKLGEEMFSSSRIEKIVLPSNCEALEKKAFSMCSLLSFIDIQKVNIQAIPERCFEHCFINTIIWPESELSIIDTEAFISSNINEVRLPNSIKIINDRCFSQCDNLRSVDLSETIVEIIPIEAFKQCIRLETVLLPKILKVIKSSALQITKINPIQFPHSLETIMDHAFEQCTNIIELDFSRCIFMKELQSYSFADCSSLDTVRLPPHIESLHLDVFIGSYHIKSFYFYGLEDVKGLELPPFQINYQQYTVYVPKEYKGTTFGGKLVKKVKSIHVKTNNNNIDNISNGDPDDANNQNDYINKIRKYGNYNPFLSMFSIVALIGLFVVVIVVFFVLCDPCNRKGSETVELEHSLHLSRDHRSNKWIPAAELA